MSSPEPLPPTDALQQQPTPPLAALRFPDVIPVAPNVALPPTSPVWTKLSLLLHAHQLAKVASYRLRGQRILLIVVALFCAILLGWLAATGVFWLVCDDSNRNAKDGPYYIRGKEATRGEYDYYVHTNLKSAVALAIPAGLFTGGLILVVFWFLLRPRRPVVMQTVEEQIAAIEKDHPEAVASWGSVAVLRVPKLIEQLLDMQTKDARRL